jgi:hypothetical protein
MPSEEYNLSARRIKGIIRRKRGDVALGWKGVVVPA